MSIASIGIQTITPQTETSKDTTTVKQSNQREADAAPTETKRAAPPPPGMGKFVDKHV